MEANDNIEAARNPCKSGIQFRICMKRIYSILQSVLNKRHKLSCCLYSINSAIHQFELFHAHQIDRINHEEALEKVVLESFHNAE